MSSSKSLSDSARELEEARAAKRKYDEVAVVTGEEDEQNALQVYGKLFTFDKGQGIQGSSPSLCDLSPIMLIHALS